MSKKRVQKTMFTKAHKAPKTTPTRQGAKKRGLVYVRSYTRSKPGKG